MLKLNSYYLFYITSILMLLIILLTYNKKLLYICRIGSRYQMTGCLLEKKIKFLNKLCGIVYILLIYLPLLKTDLMSISFCYNIIVFD